MQARMIYSAIRGSSILEVGSTIVVGSKQDSNLEFPRYFTASKIWVEPTSALLISLQGYTLRSEPRRPARPFIGHSLHPPRRVCPRASARDPAVQLPFPRTTFGFCVCCCSDSGVCTLAVLITLVKANIDYLCARPYVQRARFNGN